MPSANSELTEMRHILPYSFSTELHQRQYELGGDVQKKERRITTLNKHWPEVKARFFAGRGSRT